jgi:proteasome assembly chaperone (PAC2) family protein
MSKKEKKVKPSPGRIQKEPTAPKKPQVYCYNLGENYRVELKNNMIFYKKKNSFGDYNLVKAEMTSDNSFGSHELKVHVTDIATKMGLKLTNAITGSAIN